jgi:putative transcriptional regulator
MVQVLRNKNLATRFQILVEIAANQPYIQQKDIAKRIGVTSQAVSEYINKLEKDNWIQSDGRAHYRITKEGVNWFLKALRELQQYSSNAERALVNITTWAAVADTDLKAKQKVNLIMKRGLLYAIPFKGKGAHGITTCAAKLGEDIGITAIEDIVTLEVGGITVLEVPDIESGGSRSTDQRKLQRWLAKAEVIGAIGTEAIVTLRRLKIEPHYRYGVAPAAIEAARSGLNAAIVCSASEAPHLLQRLADENIKYKLVNTRK